MPRLWLCSRAVRFLQKLKPSMVTSYRLDATHIIPTPFDPRLMFVVPPAVAKAAIKTGVARRPIIDWDGYETGLSIRMKK